MEKPEIIKVQLKRFKGTLARAWIPPTPEEKVIYDEVARVLVPYVETLLKQTYRAGFDKGREKT